MATPEQGIEASAPTATGDSRTEPSGQKSWDAAIEHALDSGLITPESGKELKQIDWEEDFSAFVSPTDTLVTNADEMRATPCGAFIAFIEVDTPSPEEASKTTPPMGTRHIVHAMLSLGEGRAAGTGNQRALGIGGGGGWEVVDLAADLNWVPCANGFDAVNAVPLGIDKSRLLRIRYRQMKLDIDTFIKRYRGKEQDIRAVLAQSGGGDRTQVAVEGFLSAEGEPVVLDISDWSTVKKKYIGLTPDLSMQTMLAYRKCYVDTRIRKFMGSNEIAVKTVGSNDLSSDYDITVGIVGGDISGAELDVIERFNNDVRISFGKQPGTVFDTNVYAKDFLPLNDTDQDLTLPTPDEAMYKMMVEGQDIGALVKQRRYMSNADWDKYLTDLLNGLRDEQSAAKIETHRRYENADALYLLNMRELLDEFAKRAADTKTYGKAYVEAKNKVDGSKVDFDSYENQMLEGSKGFEDHVLEQLTLRHKVQKWEHDHTDLVLWASNDLYVRKMRELRAYQRKFGIRKASAGDVRVADLISSAIFFAAEAYFSEGALRHVVDGVQKAKAKPNPKGDSLREAIYGSLLNLTVEQLLQSINEQFGDFLKDYAHYDEGEFLFRGAKYVQRLFEATDVLNIKKDKDPNRDSSELSNLNLQLIESEFGKSCVEILTRLNSKADGLVAVRKGDKKFQSDSDRDDYCRGEIITYFAAQSAADLKKKISTMVQRINAQVRSKLKSTPSPDDVRQYFSAVSPVFAAQD